MTKRPYTSPVAECIKITPLGMIALSTGDDDERGPQGAPRNPFDDDEEDDFDISVWKRTLPNCWQETPDEDAADIHPTFKGTSY